MKTSTLAIHVQLSPITLLKNKQEKEKNTFSQSLLQKTYLGGPSVNPKKVEGPPNPASSS